jgi:hypothetical protein
MRSKFVCLGLFVSILASYSAHATDSFDPNTNRLTLDTVTVASRNYRAETATVDSYSLVTVGGSASAANSFDPSTNTLNLRSVAVQGTTYNNVQVRINSYALLAASDAPTIPVQRTSYLNAQNIGVVPETLPEYAHAVAFADFFQDGSLSLVSNAVVANASNPGDINKTSSIKFFKKVNGAWVNSTASILSDTTGCVWPRKAIVADFNNDGKPDVFFACTGFDASPFAGERQRVLLSQPDGTYKNTVVDITLYAHGGAAVDFNATGYADVVLTNTITPGGQPVYLRNRSDGTFSLDSTKQLPGGSVNGSSSRIYSAEIIDINDDGKFDLLFGGIDTAGCCAWPTSVSINNGANTFANITSTIPKDSVYTTTLDYLKVNSTLYIYKVNSDYSGVAIQAYDINSGASSIIYTHTGAYSNGQKWFNWMVLKDNAIYANDATFGLIVKL